MTGRGAPRLQRRWRRRRRSRPAAWCEGFEIDESFAVVNLRAEHELASREKSTHVYGDGLRIGHPPGAMGLPDSRAPEALPVSGRSHFIEYPSPSAGVEKGLLEKAGIGVGTYLRMACQRPQEVLRVSPELLPLIQYLR